MAQNITKFQRVNDGKVAFSKKLRQDSTEAEKKLWDLIRNRKLNGFKFRRQQIIGGYIADFYCDKVSLCIELDGSIHDLPDQKLWDAARTEAIQMHGIQVLRIENEKVLTKPEETLMRIASYLTGEA